MKNVLVVCVCAALLASCGQPSAEYKRLQAENDSLRIENTKNTEELNESVAQLQNKQDSVGVLIKRYEELSQKVERTAAEQKELNKVTKLDSQPSHRS